MQWGYPPLLLHRSAGGALGLLPLLPCPHLLVIGMVLLSPRHALEQICTPQFIVHALETLCKAMSMMKI
jgi:hypothetical protein